MNFPKKLSSSLLVAGSLAALAVAATPAMAVDRISQRPGFNARAWTLTQPDANGVRYVGGDFTSYNAWNTGNVAALSTATGQVNRSFPNVSTWPTIYASVSDGSGGFYVAGGGNIAVDGQSRTGLAHILADGSLDPNFSPSINGWVFDLEYDASTGTVFAVGGFTQVNGQARNRVAALDTSGTLQSFNPDTNGWTWSIKKVGTDVYFTGGFNSAAGQSRGLAASVRLGDRTGGATGTCLTNWDNADCLNAFDPQASGWAILDIAVDGGTAYVVGNALSSFGGTARTGMAAVDATTGALDSWDPGLNSDANSVLISGGKVYVVGSFSQAGGQARGWGAAFSTLAGHALESWNPAAAGGGGYNNAQGIRDIAIEDGVAYLAGNFWALGGTARNRVGAVDATTGAVTNWNPHVGDWDNGVSATAETITVSGGTALIGGDFTVVGGLPRWHAAAVGPDGILTDWAPAVSGPVYSFASNGSTIYMAGNFGSVNGQSRQYNAAVETNGQLTAWNPQPSGDRPVKVLIGNSRVYIAGFFNQVGGVSRTGLAATDPTTGALDTGFDAQVDGAVDDIAIKDDTLYVAGRYTTIGGGNRDRLAAVNASTGALVSGFDIGTWGAVHGRGIITRSLALMGNRLFVGGSFNSVVPVGESSGITRNYVAAFDTATGSLDRDWNAGLRVGGNGNGDVLAIAPTADATYLGGEEMGYNTGGVTRDGLAAVHPTTGALLDWRADVSPSEVRGLSASDAALFVAGNFSSVGGQTRTNTAAVGTDGTVLAPWPMDPGSNYPLEVEITGTDPGRVISNPGGIDCGGACEYGFASGSTVTLEATDPPGSDFAGWGGACSGTATTCTVSVTQARSVTASYGRGSGGSPTPAPTPGSGPTPGPGPTPTPTPSNSFTARTPLLRGNTMRTLIRVPGPGRISQTGTFNSARNVRSARTRVACRPVSRTVTDGGTVRMECVLTRAARSARRNGAVKVRIRTVYRPTGGTARVKIHTIVLSSLKPRYTG